MRPNLYPEELQISLDTFIQRMQLLNRADNPQLVSKIVMKWTKGQTLLTKKLLQYVLQSEPRISEGEEAEAVEKVIRNRLVKEFKKDDLTLDIRRKLYQNDLENILEVKNGLLQDSDKVFLSKLQKNLGLTDRQAQTINNSQRGFGKYFMSSQNNYIADYQNSVYNFSSAKNKGSSVATKSPDICEQSDLVIQSFTNSPIKRQPKSNHKWWLLSLIPLLFISFKGFDWVKENYVAVDNSFDVEQQKLCVDLASRTSPRMSLGEKLLTRQSDELNPAGVIASYEGMAAFARCEFLAARTKYQESLAINKNNPEALIYRNNAQAITGEHFKIAVSIPLGSKPDIAWEILRGVAQAQAEFNQKGGINNKLLLVQVVNDDNDPEVVKQLAKQLSEDKNILAVVGHNDSNSSIAGAKVYEKERLVMISPTSTSTKLSGIGSHIMRTIPSVDALASKLANYAAAKSLTKIAVCSDSEDSASGSFAQKFIEQTTQNNGQIEEIDCDFAQSEFEPDTIVGEAIAQNVDALLLAPSVNKMSQAISIAQANQQQLPLLGNHSLYTYETIESGQNAIAGMVIPSPWLSDNEEQSNFPQAAVKYWGGKVNWRTAMAYDAVGAITLGLQDSNNRSELQSVLTKSNFSVDGATGKFQFQEGDRLGRVQLAYIKKSSEEKEKYQFLKLEL